MMPIATPFFFYLLSGVAIITALLVITMRSPIHSALALIITLLSIAGLYMMLYAPFMAGVQIILYAGGIMVIFLFVIMLINLEQDAREEHFNKLWHVAVLSSIALGALIVTAVLRVRNTLPAMPHTFPESMNTQRIGTMLYKQYVLPFEVASLLLLVAIVGAVVMAKRRV